MSRHLHAVADWDGWETHAAALDVTCPRCDAQPSARCVNTETGDPMRATHWQRIRAATDVTNDGPGTTSGPVRPPSLPATPRKDHA